MLRGLTECMMRVKTKGASQPSRARRGIWLGKQILTGNNVSFSEKKYVFVFCFLFCCGCFCVVFVLVVFVGREVVVGEVGFRGC